MFQLMFAIITVALISGSIADRTKFWAWTLFAALWATLVYFPVAHWVFAFTTDTTTGDRIPHNLNALDSAGRTALHINAAPLGLALASVLGKRIRSPKVTGRPHYVRFLLMRASLLCL